MEDLVSDLSESQQQQTEPFGTSPQPSPLKGEGARQESPSSPPGKGEPESGPTSGAESNGAGKTPLPSRGEGSRSQRGSADPRKNLGTLPLVVAITGHRDLCPGDIESLEGAVRSILEKLQRDYPFTPLLMLSPLAEGADRLAARVALECGARLIAPLPMPRDEYMNDFETDASREEFMELLEQAELHFELHLVHGTSENAVRSDNVERAHQYAHVGAYIVRHCQVLIALWDGIGSAAEGGTAEIVNFMLEGVPNKYDSAESPLDPKKTGPVYHIATPRQCHNGFQGEKYKLDELYPDGYSSKSAAAEAFEQSRRHIDNYNLETVKLSADKNDDLERSRGYVLPTDIVKTLPKPQQEMLDNYAVADVLAQFFQKDTLRTLRWLFGLAFFAFLWFVFYGERRDNVWLLALSILSPIPMYVINRRANKGDYHAKHLDYRALAEGLRIQIFWHIAGLREPVAKHYLRKQRSELDWIRDAISTWNIPMESVHGKPEFDIVNKNWVDDQRSYFRKTSERDQAKVEVYDNWVRSLFGVTGGLTAIVVVLVFAGHWIVHHITSLLGAQFAEKEYENVRDFLVVMIVVLPGLAATIDGYSEKLAFAEQAKQYQRMRDLFEGAAIQLAQSLQEGSHDQAHRVIQELGEEALAENGDWVLIHRERDVEVPRAG